MHITAWNIISLTVMSEMSYVALYLQQMDWVLMHSTQGVWSDNKDFLFVVALIILTVVYSFESMSTLSYISVAAMTSLCVGLTILLWSASGNITEPLYDKNLKLYEP